MLAGSAGAQFPGANGEIAYEAQLFFFQTGLDPNLGSLQIYSGGIDLTSDLRALDAPYGFSPDGQRIAYESEHDDMSQANIFTMDAAGGSRVQLTHNTGSDTYLFARGVFSPDGGRIAYIYYSISRADYAI